MKYDIKAKATTYNGRLYRSRLEARWAYFFDRVGWKAEYEPYNMGQYSPDFSINCTSKDYPCNTIIAEVKPAYLLTKDYMESRKIVYQNHPCHILFLNESPFYDHYGYICIGQGCQYWGEDKTPVENRIKDEIFGEWSPHPTISDIDHFAMKGIADFGSTTYKFDGMVFGKINRKSFVDSDGHPAIELLNHYWATAGNEIMFLKPQ